MIGNVNEKMDDCTTYDGILLSHEKPQKAVAQRPTENGQYHIIHFSLTGYYRSHLSSRFDQFINDNSRSKFHSRRLFAKTSHSAKPGQFEQSTNYNNEKRL